MQAILKGKVGGVHVRVDKQLEPGKYVLKNRDDFETTYAEQEKVLVVQSKASAPEVKLFDKDNKCKVNVTGFGFTVFTDLDQIVKVLINGKDVSTKFFELKDANPSKRARPMNFVSDDSSLTVFGGNSNVIVSGGVCIGRQIFNGSTVCSFGNDGFQMTSSYSSFEGAATINGVDVSSLLPEKKTLPKLELTLPEGSSVLVQVDRLQNHGTWDFDGKFKELSLCIQNSDTTQMAANLLAETIVLKLCGKARYSVLNVEASEIRVMASGQSNLSFGSLQKVSTFTADIAGQSKTALGKFWSNPKDVKITISGQSTGEIGFTAAEEFKVDVSGMSTFTVNRAEKVTGVLCLEASGMSTLTYPKNLKRPSTSRVLSSGMSNLSTF
jgi:hypothetical protein